MIIPKIKDVKLKKEKNNSFDALAIECPPTDNIKSAKIAIVGEAPSDIELLKQEPFVGPAGAQFNRICAAVRLARYQIYLTNACKAKLPKNNTDKLWTSKGYRHPNWGELQALLIDELAEFEGQIIMLLGATAMKLLIDEPRFDSITKYRGSFYHAEDFPHLKDKLAGKIIGLSYHPSFTTDYKQPVHFYTMIADFNKALKIIENPNLLQDNVEIKIQSSLDEILKFYALIKSKEYVTFDIEATPEFITCFSFAIYHKDKIISMSIPFMNNQGNYWSVEEEIKVWIGLAEILNSPDIKIICQNGMFDLMFILRTMNIKTDNFYFDTMLAQHRCYTELPKGLDYLTSTYTYYPYYKDEGKQSHLKIIKDWPQYWRYNAKDSAYLFPIAEALIKELEEFESTDVMNYMMELHKPLMEMEFNGILTNQKGITKARKKYARWINALQHGLNKIVGKEINPNSSKQMIAYFYGICMIKPYINRKTGNASCDSVALHRIAKKKVKGSFEAKIIIKIRKYKKLLSTYFEVSVDDDNRLRCSHKITGTVSGRIATEKTFFGTGCLLPTAEVLTPNGWLELQHFQEGMQAMQWDNKDNSLSWCIPKKHSEFYDSKMMQLKSTQTEGTFTADHRIPSYHPGHKTFNVKSAYEISCLSERLLPLSGSFDGIKELPPLLLRLLAMVQADGTIEEFNIRISLKKQRKINRFLKLMALGDIDFTEQSARPGYRRFCISSDWSKLIQKFFFDGKTFGSWMYDLSLKAKEAFIDEIKYWDAHRRKQSYIYYTTNKVNAEIVSTLTHLVNKSCTIRIDYDNNNGYGKGENKPLYAVNIKPRNHARINRQHWNMTDYTGMVYCLQTPTSFFLVRNNDNIQITGNTNLQNQPYLFKLHLISDPDWILCEADLAKAEAHVVAYLTQDANMIESFESGIDVHSFNASKIFNLPIEEVIHEAKTKKVDQKSTMRYMGKKVVHACCSEDTEVLTYNGWEKISLVDQKEQIAVWDKATQEIFFEVPKRWNVYDYFGELYSFKGQTLNQLVTPNHRIPHYTSKDNYFKQELAKNLLTRKNLRVPINGYYTGDECFPKSLIKLAVAIQADGSYMRQTRIRFHLKNEEKIMNLLVILMELKIPFTHTHHQNDQSTYISFPRSIMTDVFLTNKKFNWNFLLLQGKYLDTFLDEILKWNGNTYQTKTGELKRYQSSIKQNCIIASTLAHLRGKQGILRKVRDKLYSVTFNETKKVGTKFTSKINYQDKVYCPTTSTGCFLIRRKDMISVTSNSNYSMGAQTFSDNLAKEEIFMTQSECKRLLQNYQDRFPGLKRWHHLIEEEVQNTRVLYNLFGSPRRFLGAMNPALFRNAYSYKPQSTVAELLNRGLIKCVNDFRLGKKCFDLRNTTTVHDSIVFQFHKSQIPNLLQILLIVNDHMKHTFTYKGRSFTIGLDAKIGRQWAGKTADIEKFNQQEIDEAIGKLKLN